MHPLARLDHRHLWHPFTQMRDWLKHEPILIAAGQGTVLRDVHGREYLDANSSIWTNLHGHRHPKLSAALQRQLRKIAHSSALGLANEPASLLARDLVLALNPAGLKPALHKVFFSDNGSTAMEVALKLAYEFARRTRGNRRPRFLSLAGAYHGDTVGAVSLGHIDLFHQTYAGLLFKTDKVMAPYCYRCRFNRARPERADARDYRQCQWECLASLERRMATQNRRGHPYAAFVFEPLMQGAAGMIAQPAGWLRRAADIARGSGAQLIADEVMTGFGRTGVSPVADPLSAVAADSKRPESPPATNPRRPQKGARSTGLGASWLACHKESVQPDFVALAKGLTGGYLPMAATLTTQAVFDAFLGGYDEFKTFFHGHSFTANQLGAAAGLASLELLHSQPSIRARLQLEQVLRNELSTLWTLPVVGDIRQVGLVAGIELVRDWRTREPFDLREQAGIRVCQAMAQRGVLTRPVGNVLVLIPPYCTTPRQARTMVAAMAEAIECSSLSKT